MSQKHSKHVCELKRDWRYTNVYKKVHLAKEKSRVLLHLKSLTRLWDKHYMTHFYFKSQHSIQQEYNRHVHGSYNYMIHPFSKFNYYKSLLMTFLWLIVILKDPFVASFLNETNKDDGKLVNLKITSSTIILANCILTFTTGYLRRKTGEVVLEPKLVAIEYVTSFFLFDFIGTIPFYELLKPFYGDHVYVRMLKWTHVLRNVRLVTLVKFLWYMLKRKQEQQILFVVIALVLCTIYSVNLFTCLIYSISYMMQAKSKNSWLIDASFDKLNLFERYINTARVSLSFLYNLDPIYEMANDIEYALGVFARAFGFAFSAFFLAILLVVTKATSSSDTLFNTIVKELEMYSSRKRLPDRLRNRLIAYYRGAFRNRFFQHGRIHSTLSYDLNESLIMHDCRFMISTTKVLENLPRSIIKTIITRSVKEYYLENDVLYKCYDRLNGFYLISYGMVTTYTPNGLEYRHYCDGSLIGEMGIITEKISYFTVVATEFTETYRISFEDFHEITEDCPLLKERVYTSAESKTRVCFTNMGLIDKEEQDYYKELAESLERKRRRRLI